MENYIVKTLVSFDDYQGLEIKPENPKVNRQLNETFTCSKERYEYLKKLGLVLFVGIEKAEPVKKVQEELTEEKPKRKTRKK